MEAASPDNLNAQLAALRDENNILTIASREDAAQIRQLTVRLEAAQAERDALAAHAADLEAQNNDLSDRIYRVQQNGLQAESAARQEVKNEFREKMEQIEEEELLLARQAEMDMKTIQILQTSLDEAIRERDLFRRSVEELSQSNEEATSRAALLESHAEELRSSNSRLAAQLAELNERISYFENEDYAQWFQRRSATEIRQGKLLPNRRVPAPASEPKHSPLHGSELDDENSPTRLKEQAPLPKLKSSADTSLGHRNVIPVRDAVSGSIFNFLPTPGAPDPMLNDSWTSSEANSPSRSYQRLSRRSGLPDDEDKPEGEAAGASNAIIEAIYGEKGHGAEKEYLVKYVGISSEQWTSARYIHPRCDAVIHWSKNRALKHLPR